MAAALDHSPAREPPGAPAHRFGGPMKVVVDFDVCQSHGLCTQAAPEVFEIRDDGFLYILNENPPEALRKKVETAVRECPTGAIKLEA
jgi:ferredoxin